MNGGVLRRVLQSGRSLGGRGLASGAAGGEAAALSAHKAKRISKAMQAYLEAARKRTAFMSKETADFELGRRHLAGMMSLDPAEMTQEDVDRAVEFLLPSALLEPRARPLMKPPERLWPKQKEPQFGLDGRPHHAFFYTLHPNFYQIMHDVANKVDSARMRDSVNQDKVVRPSEEALDLAGTEWISQEDLAKRTLETTTDSHYAQLITALEFLTTLPYASSEANFIMSFRKRLGGQQADEAAEVPPVRKCPSSGREFVEAEGRRKQSHARVQLWLGGRGAVSLNGIPLGELPGPQNREQLMAPFVLLDRLSDFDVTAETWQNPSDDKSCEWHLQHPLPYNMLSAKCGAARLAVARALTAVVPSADVEKLRLAGLLSEDYRQHERMRPGQKGARAKWKWQKR